MSDNENLNNHLENSMINDYASIKNEEPNDSENINDIDSIDSFNSNNLNNLEFLDLNNNNDFDNFDYISNQNYSQMKPTNLFFMNSEDKLIVEEIVEEIIEEIVEMKEEEPKEEEPKEEQVEIQEEQVEMKEIVEQEQEEERKEVEVEIQEEQVEVEMKEEQVEVEIQEEQVEIQEIVEEMKEEQVEVEIKEEQVEVEIKEEQEEEQVEIQEIQEIVKEETNNYQNNYEDLLESAQDNNYEDDDDYLNNDFTEEDIFNSLIKNNSNIKNINLNEDMNLLNVNVNVNVNVTNNTKIEEKEEIISTTNDKKENEKKKPSLIIEDKNLEVEIKEKYENKDEPKLFISDKNEKNQRHRARSIEKDILDLASVYDNWQFTRLNNIQKQTNLPNKILANKILANEIVDFDWQQYVKNYSDLIDINNQEKAWEHWISFGREEGRTYLSFNNQKQNTITSTPDNFDWKQYINNYNDLSEINTYEDALYHWLNHGQFEGRQFKSIQKTKEQDEINNFDWIQYIKNYNDLSVIDNYEDALFHWLNHGKFEGRQFEELKNEVNKELPNDFDWRQYINNYNDLQDSGVENEDDAIYHWLNHGQYEGRHFKNLNKKTIIKDFNWKQYVQNYQDLTEIDNEYDAWYHWINHGQFEGRKFKSLDEHEYISDNKIIKKDEIIKKDKDEKDFNWKQYIENYQDLKESGMKTEEEAWSHWINHGKKEGRSNHNFYQEELEQEYNSKIYMVTYNNINILFKSKYDRYGTHYFGWKGAINQFINWFCEKNANKVFKYNIFFDEWIEKLLIWGNKLINTSYLNEIHKHNYKLISFIHNPPFLQLNNKTYKNKISKEVIISDKLQFNDNLIYEMEKNNVTEKLVFIYTLSNCHKEYIYNTFPHLQRKLVSVHHPMDLDTKPDSYFDINEFMNNKKIYSIGWWLRNYKTFIDFVTPKKYTKHILVKNDFKVPFENTIMPNYDMSNIEIINEINNDDYCNIFKNSCVFTDIVDCIANNTILECIKFNTPIILRRSKSAEEYLGINYPLFFSESSELYILREESFFLDLVVKSHYYLKNLNKTNINLNTFNLKINYDLNKLVINKDIFKLTWCCFIDLNSSELVDKIIKNFVLQTNFNSLKLLFFTLTTDEESELVKNIKIYMKLYDNIDFILLDVDYITLEEEIFASAKNVQTSYITIVNPNDIYKKNYSKTCIKELDNRPNCDITFTSYNCIDKVTNNKTEQIFSKDLLINKLFIENNLVDNRGIVWRKDIYDYIENIDLNSESNSNNNRILLEEEQENQENQENQEKQKQQEETHNINFWTKCVENHMNMINISDLPLFSIYE